MQVNIKREGSNIVISSGKLSVFADAVKKEKDGFGIYFQGIKVGKIKDMDIADFLILCQNAGVSLMSDK